MALFGENPLAAIRRAWVRDPRWRWLGRETSGLALGLAGVALGTAIIFLLDTRAFDIPSPTLTYTLLVLGIALGWGWRVGTVVAAAAFFASWYFLIPPRLSFKLDQIGELARLLLAAATFTALVVAGDALRRVRHTNARLARTVERLDTVIASIADGLLITDPDGDLLQTNDGMRRIVGQEIPRTLAERDAAWRPRQPSGEPLAPGSGRVRRALAGETVTGCEILVRNAAGEDRLLSVSSAPLRDRGGRVGGVVSVARDVTELRRLQQVKDDFLSVASHELRTPLTSLGGYLELLRRHFDRTGVTDERALRYLAMLQSQMVRMRELIDTLLDVSRIDAGRLSLRRAPFDLVALAREVAEETGGLSDRHRIAVRSEVRAVEGAWDRDRVAQVLANLLNNALRYTPDGGTIVVTVGVPPETTADGAGTDQVPRGAAFVRVSDPGLGVPPDQLAPIFERFHQAHETVGRSESARGMGLGLFISREIVEAHGGRIWAESAGPGRGTTFTFTLPGATVVAAGVSDRSAVPG